MTRDEAEARGRRALAAGFGWWHGVLGLESRRRVSWDNFPDDQVTLYYRGGLREGDRRVRPDNGPLLHNDVPDFRDPATVGVLRAQAAERVKASGSRAFWVEYDPANEEWYPMHSWDMPRGGQDAGPLCGPEETEVDALLAALEVCHEG